MPEGPSILLLKEKLTAFKGRLVKKAGGYGKLSVNWLKNKRLLDIKTWGKHLLLVFSSGTIKIHLGLFGKILVNERKKVNRSFYLEFADGEINGYVVRTEKLEDPLDSIYDWRTDIMSTEFDKAYVKSLIKKNADKTIADVLINQDIFTGSGNIIRNEALYRAGIHPMSIVQHIPAVKLNQLIREVLRYAKEFYNELRKNGRLSRFDVYKQDYAPDGTEVNMKLLPSKRKVYYSERHQHLYN